MFEAIFDFFADSLFAANPKAAWVFIVVVFIVALPILFTGWGFDSLKLTVPLATVFVILMFLPRRG